MSVERLGGWLAGDQVWEGRIQTLMLGVEALETSQNADGSHGRGAGLRFGDAQRTFEKRWAASLSRQTRAETFFVAGDGGGNNTRP